MDTCDFQCVYYHQIYDPDRKESRFYYEILQVGDAFSKYEDYARYQLDSLMKTLPTEDMTFDDYMALSRKYDGGREYLTKDLRRGNLVFYGSVFMDSFIYEEPIPSIAWKLENETEEVCGFLCHKATTSFRGRVWTAWYSDIPVNNGPWKFGNLPGLILKLEDAKGEHKFKAVGFKTEPEVFGYGKRDRMRTKRAQYNRALGEYKAEAWKMVEGTELQPKNMDGTPMKVPRRKLFYNPIELE